MTLPEVMNLTQRPPRSVRVRLGGFVFLPRLLDKCRATIAGVQGEFKYDSPLDKHFFNFVGLDAEALRTEVATGKTDTELLEWIMTHAKNKPMPWDICQWSQYQEHRGPDSDVKTLAFFAKRVAEITEVREDIKTWADLLDLDDFVSFGGKP